MDVGPSNEGAMSQTGKVGSVERSGKKRRPSKLRMLGFCVALAFVLFLIFLPRLATQKSVLNAAIQQFAGLAPLQVEIEKVDAGWFVPIAASGLAVKDADGTLLARIGQVQTQKGVFHWLLNASDIGLVTIKELDAAIVAHQGTTNLEQALQPLLERWANEPAEPSPSSSATTRGTIEVLDAKVLLMESGRPEQWVVSVPKMTATLPDSHQMVGPIEAQITLSEVSGQSSIQPGVIAAEVRQVLTEQQSVGAHESRPRLQVRAKLDRVPLQFWHVVHARLPEIEVDEVHGTLSAILAGTIVDENEWRVQFNGLEGRDLKLVAPQLVGEQPALLSRLTGQANCQLSKSLLQIDETQLACDFATATAKATVPWPIVVPTAAEPFLSGATLEASGAVDLARLAVAAESLLPLKDEMQLNSGVAKFEIQQALNEVGQASNSAWLQLSDLSAVANGQSLQWKDALKLQLAASQTEQGPRMEALVQADFAELEAGGTIENGNIVGRVDFSLLRQRLSDWVEVPISNMQGSAQLNARWNMESEQLVAAEGTFKSTPLAIGISNGKQIEESAWDGRFSARIGIQDASPKWIQNASLTLQSQEERLVFDLNEPLSLDPQASADVQPAAFRLDVHADLARCLRRGNAWLDEPAEMSVNGKLQLAANGLLDMQHLELHAANWNGEPIQVVTPQLSFSEPRVVGNFKGRIDTNALTRTVIESLELTSSSVSLIAQDYATPQGAEGRTGRARFIMDLGRLMQNSNSGSSSLISAASPSASELAISANGRCEGELAWQISSQAAGVSVLVNGSNLVLMSKSQDQTQTEILWQEPTLTSSLEGTWKAADNAIDLSSMKLQTPWLNYAGTLAYRSSDESQQINMNGQAIYDCQTLSNKLTPYTGGEVMLVGKQTAPIQLTWQSSGSNDLSPLAGLNAATRLGWQQASVIGIPLGAADVPVEIVAGQLKSAAEIPVNGGALRWDLQSDLTADDLVLKQQPMTVLDNVQITQQMCNDWLKYVNPLMADATSVDGRLSLTLNEALLRPYEPAKQSIVGQLVIHNASVGPGPFSNQIIGIVKQIEAIRKQDFTRAVSSTQRIWLDMPEQRINFAMRDGKVSHDNLQARIGDATVSTSGGVYVDGRLELMATMPIPDDWADKSPYLAGLKGQSLQFPVDGTMTDPSVDTQLLGQLGRKTAENAALGFLNQGLNRGLEKLLGNPGEGTQSTTPNQQPPQESPEKAILGIGEQIFKGQGIKLPGLFGSPPPAPQAGSPQAGSSTGGN